MSKLRRLGGWAQIFVNRRVCGRERVFVTHFVAHWVAVQLIEILNLYLGFNSWTSAITVLTITLIKSPYSRADPVTSAIMPLASECDHRGLPAVAIAARVRCTYHLNTNPDTLP